MTSSDNPTTIAIGPQDHFFAESMYLADVSGRPGDRVYLSTPFADPIIAPENGRSRIVDFHDKRALAESKTTPTVLDTAQFRLVSGSTCFGQPVCRHRNGLPAVVTLTESLARQGIPTHYHLHDGHPLIPGLSIISTFRIISRSALAAAAVRRRPR